jgi:hypothetical protein
MFGEGQSRSEHRQSDLLAARPLKPKRFIRVIVKSTRIRFRRRFTRFERRDLALHFPAGRRHRDSARRNLVDDRELIRIGRATLCLPRLCPQSRPKVIMDSAAGHLDGTFVREYLGDLPIRPTPTAKLLNEFSVRLKAGTRRLAWQFVQKFFQVGVHVREFGGLSEL